MTEAYIAVFLVVLLSIGAAFLLDRFMGKKKSS